MDKIRAKFTFTMIIIYNNMRIITIHINHREEAHMKTRLRLLLLSLLLLGLAGCAPAPVEAPAEEPVEVAEEPAEAAEAPAEEAPVFEDTSIVLATTTSTDDSGLLDFILPVFEEQYGATVEVVAVGTGQAIEMGMAGDADVLLVHARSKEDQFVTDGYAKERFDVMYNDFVFVGPADDPAGLADAADLTEALTILSTSGLPFISRGDDSGTHTKELSLWDKAAITPEGDWYVSAGQGMGAVLTMTDEMQGYTLTDRATYLSMQAEGLPLVILFEGDEALFNPYGVLLVSDEKYPETNTALGQAFVDWIVSVETQELINSYTINGAQLFYANSAQWLAAGN